jgi:hypothetical protein
LNRHVHEAQAEGSGHEQHFDVKREPANRKGRRHARKAFAPEALQPALRVAQADLEQHAYEHVERETDEVATVQKAEQSHRNGVVRIMMASIADDHVCRRQTL